jgi:hypothetical protein
MDYKKRNVENFERDLRGDEVFYRPQRIWAENGAYRR